MATSPIEDLSRYDQPVSGLFPRITTPESAARFRLSDEQLVFYREHGYVAGMQVLSENQVEALRAAVEIVEFNPHRDVAGRTARLVGDLLLAAHDRRSAS